ncbi:MAG: lauroyl acyltransferase [Pseudomonadota bacterium]|nr:lauroyl acyltransferase [Pseudomonadota bacterium]MEC9077844.1 lauroyl acyltransferase [Pseudomonadota bacterium]
MSKPRSKLSRTFRFVKYPFEASGLILLLLFFACLTPIAASNLGGYLGRKIGPSLGINRRALKNMDEALTDFDQKTITNTIIGMWENLGRVVGEMPHIRHIARWARADQIEIINRNYLTQFHREGQPVIYFSGHFANWELFPLILRELGAPTAAVYRAANNPIVDFLLRYLRRLKSNDTVPKGPSGAKKIIQLMKAGKSLGMLVDQKMNDGISIPFFGRDAMTSSALATLALKYNCPAIPIRLERVRGCSFRATILPPLAPPETGDRKKDIELMMTMVNEIFEGWIIERPDQWFWLHNRWPNH